MGRLSEGEEREERQCPRCGRRVFSVVIRGPTECHATPCGCRVPCHEDFDEVLDGVG